jgi:hypothetical protein
MRGGGHILAALALCTATPVAAQPPSDEALTKMALPKEQLSGMLAEAVFHDRSMAINAFLLGIEPVCAAYARAADKSVAKYLPQWRANVLRAYRAVVPAETLARAAADGAGGRARLAPYMAQIGAVMEQSSGALLKQSTTDVLREIGSAAAGVNPAKVDQHARVAELKDQIAKTGKLCGVIEAADNIAKSESLE